MRVISLGWGVQSFTLAAMAALGDLPPVDAALHADTLNERADTYVFARKWTPWLREHGINVVTVTNPVGDIFEVLETPDKTYVPAYTVLNGKHGQLNRSCTQRWKIAPMRKWLGAQRQKGASIEMLLGISLDEWTRAKDSDVKYIRNVFPLLEKRMTRADCVAYLRAHNLEVPGKSACVFCPFHNQRAWREIKECAQDWDIAVRADSAIRDQRLPYQTYMSSKCVPITELNLATPEEEGQLSLFDLPCDSGYCFL